MLYPTKIYRCAPPSPLDTADYLTLCHVENGQYYIQLSHDENQPNWQLFEGSEDEAESFRETIKNKPG